jgi:hypothetical protein
MDHKLGLDLDNVLSEQRVNLESALRHIQRGPITLFIAATTIAVLSIALTVIGPALVSVAGKSFYSKDIENRLPPQARTKLQKYQAQTRSMEAQLDQLDAVIGQRLAAAPTTGMGADLQGLVLAKRQLGDDLKQLKDTPPVSVLGFYLNPQMLLWPGIYTALLCLVILARPPHVPHFGTRECGASAMIAFGLYCAYEWPLWARNFLLGSEARVVYAYPNFDVDRGSFFMQEGVIFGFCYLIAVLIRQWGCFLRARSTMLRKTRSGPLDKVLDGRHSELLSLTYIHWTYCSVILGLGFAFFTSFYWNLVTRYHDQRYLLSAIQAHLLWAGCWLAITLPLMVTWIDWNNARAFAIQELYAKVASGEQDKVDAVIKLMDSAEPVGRLNLVFANTAAAVSFAYPILQAVLK